MLCMASIAAWVCLPGLPWLAVLSLLVALAAFGIMLVWRSYSREGGQRRSLMLAWAVAGVILSGIGLLVLQNSGISQSTGMHSQEISACTALAMEDARISYDGRIQIPVRVFMVSDLQGRRVQAACDAILVSDDQSLQSLCRGQVVNCNKLSVRSGQDGAPLRIVAGTVTPVALPESTPVMQWRHELRRQVFSRMASLPAELSGLSQALLFGRQDLLDPGMAAAFRETGCLHIVALSGMHVAMLAALCGFVLQPLAGKKRAFVLSLFICSLFVYFVGNYPSVIRALLFFGLYGLWSQLGYRPSLLAVHCASIPFAMCLFPFSVMELGFQLSWAALLGILLFAKVVRTVLLPYFKSALADGLGTSIAATICTIPILLLHDMPLRLQGIVAGLVLSPLALLYIVASLLAYVLAFFCPALLPYGESILGFLYAVIRLAAHWFQSTA